MLLEILQITNQGLDSYIKQRSNLIDIGVLILSLTSVVMIFLKDSIEVNMYWVRIVASLNSVLMWVQVFFWMRLFDSTA